MVKHPLDFNTRKALCVHLGDDAGTVLATVILKMAEQIERLERNKIDSIPIVRAPARLIRLYEESDEALQGTHH